MAVVVTAAARDHGDTWPQLGELGREAVVGGAVVGDLEDLDRPVDQARRHLRLRVRGQERVDLPVAREEHDGEQVRVRSLAARRRRPQHAKAEPAQPEAVSCADLENRNAAILRRGEGVALLLPRHGQTRIEHTLDGEPAQNVRGAADVVALRMRQDDRRQAAYAERAQLPGHVRLRRPLVDEDRALRHLQQHGVALADVQEGDPQARRRRQPRVRRQLPGEECRDERRRERDRGRAAPARQPLEPEQRERDGEQERDREAGVDLRERESRDGLGAGGDVRGEPPVQPRERERCRRQHRRQQRPDERGPEQRRDRERDEHVREERPQRHAPELEPQDRGGGRPAGGRDGERVADPGRHRVALERRLHARHDDEDGCDGGERELEARLEQRRRRPGEQDGRADGEEVPAVARPRDEPRERRESARDPRAHDRRLPADREDVRDDRGDRERLADEAADAEQPREADDPDREISDVLAGDGEQVVEPGRLELVLELRGQPLVLAEDDPDEHGSPLPFEPRRDRLRDVAAEPVR